MKATFLYESTYFTTVLQYYFRKRGGSVDNLLDDLDGVEKLQKHKQRHSKLSRHSKKKSLSSKNLTGLGPTTKTSDIL